MYSFAPLADTSASHLGFYIFLAICLFFCGFILYGYLNGGVDGQETLGFIGFAIFVTLLVAGASYTDKPPVNAKVPGEFKGFTAEAVDRTSGKSTTTDHYLYATFKISTGIVALKVAEGTVIPEKVILFKN